MLVATSLLVFSAPATAESSIPDVPSDGSITPQQIEAAINAISANDTLVEETRTAVIGQLRNAQAQLQNRLAAEAAKNAFTASLETAPLQTEALRRELNQPTQPTATAAALGISGTTPVEEVERRLSSSFAEVASAEARLSELDSQVATLEARPAAARQRINELRATRDQVAALIDAAPPPGEAPLLTDARKLATAMRLDARAAELARLEQELVSHSVRLELARVQRDVAARNLARLRDEANSLQAAANERRQSAAKQALQEAALAELAAADSHPVVRALAERNAELTRELPEIVASTERVTRNLGEVEDQVRQIEQAHARSLERLEIGGVSQVIGRLFVEERRNLPQVSQYHAEVRARRKTLAQIGLVQVRIKEQRRELTPIAASIESTMAEVSDGSVSDAELLEIREQVEGLLRNRRDLLNQVETTYTSYIRALGDLDVAQKSLLDEAEEYKEFLDQHLLWIPSADFFGLQAVKNLGSALAWVLAPDAWADALESSLGVMRANIGAALAALAGLLLVLLAQRPLTARFKAINARVGGLFGDHIGLTFAALGISIVKAAPVPLALVLASASLRADVEQSAFGASLSYAFAVIAPFLYNASLFRVLCARDGVLQLHFGWGTQRLQDIRRQMYRLMVIGVPLIFIAALTYSSPVPGHRESLGRLAFIAMMLLFSGVARPLIHPVTGVVTKFYERNASSWVSRLRWVWYGFFAGVPLVLAVISVIGYLYTAAILTGRLIDTFWLFLTIGIASLVIRRWLALARQKIAGQLESEQREAAAAAAGDASDAEIPDVVRKPLDLDAIDQQTRRIVNAALIFVGVLVGWGIWSDVVPALGVLERVALWSQTVMIDGQQTVVPVTLADLLLALVIMAVTGIAAKNLPGLMEIMVLQHMTLQPGSRYAINTLLRYVVVTIGAITVLSIIGWDWSQIQWLVAALSVGLGFGLQEIVANFVSGLVILFERPVRVGDTVTVGQLTGKVSRVRIRATTITDWDRKEIIVPNKAFITEQVINWTLSDPITRIVIPVGVAYGSDVNLAHRVMEETLHRMPLVLDEPPPRVYFTGFGDSSLDFKLYVFSRELEDRLPLTHAVHGEILAALRENHIEIPFPQRDLHVRSVSPDVKGLRDDNESGD